MSPSCFRREAVGALRCQLTEGEKRHHIYPRRELTALQYRMMSTQPDMIVDYARHLARRYEARGYRNVRVYADSWVALNRRPSQRLIAENVDLAAEKLPSGWILPFAQKGSQ